MSLLLSEQLDPLMFVIFIQMKRQQLESIPRRGLLPVLSFLWRKTGPSERFARAVVLSDLKGVGAFVLPWGVLSPLARQKITLPILQHAHDSFKFNGISQYIEIRRREPFVAHDFHISFGEKNSIIW